MMRKFQVSSSKSQVPDRYWDGVTVRCNSIVNRLPRHSKAKAGGSKIANGFTLVEMLVTLVLLSLIVLALTAVFNSTQQAFRASLTQTDILESGRNVMGLIASDLETMTPSYSTNDLKGGTGLQSPEEFAYYWFSPVNFYMNLISYNPNYQYLIQYMPGGSPQRANVLENFFILGRENVNGRPTWVGSGYAVDSLSFPTNSLYRFYMTTNVLGGDPMMMFRHFVATATHHIYDPYYIPFTNTFYWTHLMDGVVDLRVRAYDPVGLQMTNTYEVNYNGSGRTNYIHNTFFLQRLFIPLPSLPPLKTYGFFMYSNTVPASVGVELGVVENATLQHAEGLPSAAAMNYLSNHVGQVHLFRQQVRIPSVDPTVYELLP